MRSRAQDLLTSFLAWRSNCGWRPFIALTALATAIHIPAYVVVVVGAFCCF